MSTKKPTAFHIRDFVLWDMAKYPKLVSASIAEHGRGPFRVVGVQLLSEQLDPKGHPEFVTIEIPKKGVLRRYEFSGDCLRKIRKPRMPRSFPF